MRETDRRNDTTGPAASQPGESASPVVDDAIVWPEPSPLESWWEHVVHDHPAPPPIESALGTDR
ncbi:hypothetical protein P3H15_45975 [Rhodococcus sp. T2V]|uniref:hypothetical protein n=1 Tax=Rhodococcus sp. T2V TaxID=3034164 RepID=UPI0023E23B53|nr:hypothetical protein [Rhodococcus sp. T2V]MDF3312307.1 hypothetical protein [Rhodococcus sp. T2V]